MTTRSALLQWPRGCSNGLVPSEHMNFNPLLIPTLILALVLFWVGEWWARRCSNPVTKRCALLGGFALSIPGILFALYYLHVFGEATWFYEFRAFPCSELTASGAGLFAGTIMGCLARCPRLVRVIGAGSVISLLCLGIALPHLKPILSPVPTSEFSNHWTQGVCLQSTGSSCGPASTATILKVFGMEVTEAQLAKECFTYSGGTENWFLARALFKRGLKVRYRLEKRFPSDLHLPAIAGVNVGCGHFIPILSETETTYITGDPLVGRREYPKKAIFEAYRFTGFFMEIRKKP